MITAYGCMIGAFGLLVAAWCWCELAKHNIRKQDDAATRKGMARWATSLRDAGQEGASIIPPEDIVARSEREMTYVRGIAYANRMLKDNAPK